MIKSKEKLKQNYGITLIALVITIIVLLILAGVTIATLMGDNGILTKTTEASEETEIAQEKEEVSLAYTAAKANKENYGDLVTDAEMNDELDKLNSTGTAAGTVTLTVTFESGREYTINQENGEITGPNKALTDDELKDKLQQFDGDAYIDANGNIFDTSIYENIITSEDTFYITGDSWEGGYMTEYASGYYGGIIDGNLEYDIPMFLKQGNEIYKLTEIADNVFYNCYNLTDITIPDGVTSIGSRAFMYCHELENITIPNSITSIGGSAFYGCDKLTNITIPNSVTSIGGAAFKGCGSLANIAIPNSVTSIESSAFYGCTKLTSVIIPDSVTSIGYQAFAYCGSLENITIPNSVTSIESSAFYRCTKLTSITINKTKDSITGAKWGADNATVTWTDGVTE